jgi:hypothetical protein
MNWQTKSKIQRACAALPIGRDSVYYTIQRYGGSLRQARDPRELVAAGASLAQNLSDHGFGVEGKRLMEIGTGRYLELPIAMYLAGAGSILTVDLNPLLKERLVLESIAKMKEHRNEILANFSRLQNADEVKQRFERLTSVKSLADVLKVASIQYYAPSDATSTGLPNGCIDVQFSYTVFEHIQGQILLGILREANRILSPRGAAIHHIDPSDHFAHDDHSISFVNFLQYSEEEWARLAGNPFAYHNRLRSSDYARIYQESGHTIRMWNSYVNEECVAVLKKSFPLAPQYNARSVEDLASVVLRVLSTPQSAT